MPRIGEMIESKFLKKEDVNGETGVLVTITHCFQTNVALPGVEPEMKWALSFEELDKPLVLNVTNIQMCAKACGSEDTDHWMSKKVVLYEDPSVSFGGKVVGGIRVRAPRKQAEPSVPQRKAEKEKGDDVY